MARQVASGTPSKSARHGFSSGNRRLLLLSVAGGLTLTAALALLFAIGDSSALSPGSVAAPHAGINEKCALCHDEGRSMWRDGTLPPDHGEAIATLRSAAGGTTVRCERCHDPAVAGRLTNASHVLLGSGDPVKAGLAPEIPCTQCHTDHRGAQAVLRRVDDRECAACHRRDFTGVLTLAPLTSFATHPEFAAFKAQRTTGVGLLFNHLTHFDYVLRVRRSVKDVSDADAIKGSLETCDRCHIATRDRREFVPVAFDSGCAGSMCHTDERGLINEGTRDVTVAGIVLNVPGAVTPSSEGDDRVKVFSGFAHRDEWLQFNAAWLRASIDPGGARADRDAMRSSLAWLDQQAAPPPWQAATADDLTRWKAIITKELTDLDARIASPPTAGGELAALSQDLAAVQTLLGAIGGSADAAAEATRATSTGQPDDDPGQLLAIRRRELLDLLAAVRARAERSGDRGLADKAAALEARVNQLHVNAARPPADLKALRRELIALDEVVRAVRSTNDAQARQDLAELQALRESASGSGLGAADFELRRQEIARLLDALAQRGNPALQQSIADLRARLAAIQPNSGTLDDLSRRRRDRERVLGRIQLELELAGSPDRATALPAIVRDEDARRLATDIRPTLARLDRAAASPPAADADRNDRRQTLSAVLAPCLKCHLYDGEDEITVNPVGSTGAGGIPTRTITDALSRRGLKLARVAAAEPVMKRALFTHGPHLAATNCGNCHASLNRSTLALDLNSPGVATCQSCHKSSGATTACYSCHVYHPATGGTLLQSVWSAN